MRFEPRAVPSRHALRWLREAVALTARAPIAFVALGLAPAALLALPGRLGDAGFAALPLVIGFGAALAAALDRGGPSWTARVSRRGGLRLLGVGAGIAAAALVLVAALASLDGDGTAATSWPPPLAAANAANEALATSARATWFWCLVFGPALWFLVPLLGVADLPTAPALGQAVHAFALNRFLVAAWAVAAGAFWLATLVPVLTVPCTALWSAALYAGYRDVWPGRTRDAARAPRAAAPSAAVRVRA